MPKGNADRDPLDDVLRPPLDETEGERSIRLQTEEKAKRVSDAIDEALRQERQAAKKKDVVRLLLLGQSESGATFLPSSQGLYSSVRRQGNPQPSNVGSRHFADLPVNPLPFQNFNGSIPPRLSAKRDIYGVA
jgi:hypothetical protein